TRRLDPRALPMAQVFYPGHPFDAAVLPGVRSLQIGDASGQTNKLDKAIDVAGESGWAHITLPGATVTRADPDTAAAIVKLIKRLLGRGATWRDEEHLQPQSLTTSDIIVGVAHNDQRDVARTLLDEAGLHSVGVETANRLQG